MNGPIPRGIEVLVRKASIDAEFRAMLLERRAAAAESISLELTAAEAAMLAAVSPGQLEAIIARTSVPQEHRRAFLGHAAAAMLAAMAAMVTGRAFGEPRPEAVGGARAPDPGDESLRTMKPEKRKEYLTKRITALVAKRFGAKEDDLKPETSLTEDLKANASQMVNLRRQLAKTFKVEISRKDFEKVHTIGEAVDCVITALQKRWEGPSQPPPNATRGIQPDLPPGGTFGNRPDPPPPTGGIRPH